MKLKKISEIEKNKISDFTCGVKELDLYLRIYAKKNDRLNISKTFILLDNDKIIGYFTLCAAQIENIKYPKSNNIPLYPLPSIRIARLAVSYDQQNKGYGKLLMKYIIKMVLMVSNIIGVYLILVDAKKSAISFYTNIGFSKLLNSFNTFYLPVEDLKV